MRPEIALDIEIPSDIQQVERVVKLATDLCETLNLPPHVCSLNVAVSLSEALSNAILRGNRADISKHVRVRAMVSEHTLVFEVIDEGRGFDLDTSLDDPRLPSNLEREDGRGLFLMRELMDRVEQFRSSEGNVVRLTLTR